MSKYARTKGHSFEREIAKEFRELGFKEAMTTRAARGGDWSFTDDGIDLVGTKPFAVQCKRLASYASVNTIEEIVRYEHENEIPLLITKANNKPTMAVIAWEDLKALIDSTVAA